MDNKIKVGELVKWNGDKSGRIDKVTRVVKDMFAGEQCYTIETNPAKGETPKIGKQFFDYTGENKDRGVGLYRA